MGTSVDAKSKYHQTKYIAEKAIISSGLDWVIFRPSVVYGPGDGFISMLTKMIKLLPFTPVIGSGRYKLQPFFIDDLTDAMVQGLSVEYAKGKIFDVGGARQLEYLEILTILKRVLGKKRVNFYMPTLVMKKIAALLELFLSPAPLTRDQLIMMEAGNIGDNGQLNRIFGISPIEFERGLLKYMREKLT